MEETQARKELNVIFTTYTEQNPYLKSLTSELEKTGTKIKRASFRTFLQALFSPAKEQWIVHLHWLYPLFLSRNLVASISRTTIFLSGLLLFRMSGIKIAWTIHNLKDHENRYPLLERIVKKAVVDLANALIIHWEGARQAVICEFGIKNSKKIHVIPQGSYIGYYKKGITAEDARKKIDIRENAFVFLFFGRICPYKGVLRLIDVFKKLDNEEACLLIVGEPIGVPLEEILNNVSVNQNIKTVLGHVDDDDLQIYMEACNVVVLPYEEIFTTATLVVAMSFAKPCIAPELGYIKHILENDSIQLYDPQEENGLLTAIRNAITKRQELSTAGNRNFQSIQQWNWKDSARLTSKVYRSCFKE